MSTPSLWRPARGIPLAGFVGGLAVACGVALTATSGWLIVEASMRPVILTLLTAIVGVRAFGIGRPVFRYWERIISHDAALSELRDRRTHTYRRLIPLTPARLGTRRRADLLTAVVRDLDDEVDVQVRSLVPFIANLVTCAVALLIAFWVLPAAGWVMAVYCGSAVVVATLDWSLERRGQRESLAARAQVQRAAHLVSSSALELRAIAGEEAALGWLSGAQKQVERAAARQAAGRAAGVGLSLLLTGGSTAAMAYAVRGQVNSGLMDAAIAALLVMTPLALGDILGMLPDAVGALARGQAAHRRLAALLGQPRAVSDAGGEPFIAAAPTITLSDVTASWTGDQQHLDPVSLTIRPGEHIAIVGPNGSGKSTLLAVLARHLDPTAGRYDIEGCDVRTLARDDIRALFAIVDDEPHIFAGTVRANLLLAAPGATDAQLVNALLRAGLGHWLAGLPDGLDTVLGAGARAVSGGERARFALARALISERPVILLDEPVAHLDRPTARGVLADLHDATRGRTVVIVSHQAIGREHCDRMVALTTTNRVRFVTEGSLA